MDTTGNYKDRALSVLEGNWRTMVLLTFLYIVIAEGVSRALTLTCQLLWHAPEAKLVGSLLGIPIALVLLPVQWSYVASFLRLRNGEQVKVNNLFDGFKDYTRIFVTKLLQFIYTMLWMMLFIVPGVMKSYSYAMTDFILLDDPTISDDKAIDKSMKMMEGHRMELFMLDLSFIGWALLAILTCGLGFLLLSPYVYAAHAEFYEDLKQQGNSLEDITNL